MPRGFLSEDALARRAHRVSLRHKPPVDWLVRDGLIGPEDASTPDNDDFTRSSVPDVGQMETDYVQA